MVAGKALVHDAAAIAMPAAGVVVLEALGRVERVRQRRDVHVAGLYLVQRSRPFHRNARDDAAQENRRLDHPELANPVGHRGVVAARDPRPHRVGLRLLVGQHVLLREALRRGFILRRHKRVPLQHLGLLRALHLHHRVGAREQVLAHAQQRVGVEIEELVGRQQVIEISLAHRETVLQPGQGEFKFGPPRPQRVSRLVRRRGEPAGQIRHLLPQFARALLEKVLGILQFVHRGLGIQPGRVLDIGARLLDESWHVLQPLGHA